MNEDVQTVYVYAFEDNAGGITLAAGFGRATYAHAYADWRDAAHDFDAALDPDADVSDWDGNQLADVATTDADGAATYECLNDRHDVLAVGCNDAKHGRMVGVATSYPGLAGAKFLKAIGETF